MMLDYHSARELEKLREQLRSTLERTNVAHMGDVTVVRIPDIPGKTRHIPRSSWEGSYSVEYKSGQWYDGESGQTRNEKHIIGMVIPEYPMAMIPNENYYHYFDLTTGLPKAPEDTPQPPPETAVIQTQTKPPTTIPNTKNNHSPSPDLGNGEPDDPDSEPEEDSAEDILQALQDTRKRIEESKRRERERAKEEERRKRNRELYGEDAADEEEAREATLQLMKLFENIEPKDPGMKTEEEKTAGSPPPEREETKTAAEKAEDDLQQAYTDYSHAKERRAILAQILDEILVTIQVQAKKRPDDIVNTYKVNKINALLQEIRERYRDTGYEDLLDLLDLPREEEKDGRIIRTGPTYSDTEVLLDHYHTILYFVRDRK